MSPKYLSVTLVTHLIKVAVNQTGSEFIASHTVSVNTLLPSDSSNVETFFITGAFCKATGRFIAKNSKVVHVDCNVHSVIQHMLHNYQGQVVLTKIGTCILFQFHSSHKSIII